MQDVKAIQAIEKQAKGVSQLDISYIFDVRLLQVLDRYPELVPVRQDIQPVIKEQHDAWRLEKLPSARTPIAGTGRTGKPKKTIARASSQGSDVSSLPQKRSTS